MLPALDLQRIHRYRFSGFPSSFGPGVYLGYDLHLELNRTDPATGSGSILYFFTGGRARVNMFETSSLYGDQAQDGIYHDQSFANISELRLFDAGGALVADQALAATAVLRQHDGTREVFEVIRLSSDPATNQRWARLVRREDRNGNAVVIGYAFPRTATDAELGGSRAKLWQMTTITDAYGRAASFTYHPTQVAGRWVVASIALPNGTSVSYGYDATGLTRVTYPDGAVSTITRSTDAALQQTVISYVEAGAEGIHRRKEARLTTSSFVNPDGTTTNQTAGMIRSIRNGVGEYSYFNQEDPANDQVILIYDGGDKLLRLTTSSFDHVRTAEVATNWTIGQPLTGLTFELLEAYETNPQARITKRTDILGRSTRYEVDARTAMVTRIFHPDGTTTTRAGFTPFGQATVITDRLGRVRTDTYDERGNLVRREQATGTPDAAVWTWTHDARGQVLQERDALYAGATPDLHVTNHLYDAAGFLTSVLASADLPGGVRATRAFTYDASGRRTRATDPDSRTVDFTYDSRNRITHIHYGRNVGITDDFEQFTYATGGQDVNLLVRQRDRNGNLTDFAYDAAGRPIRTTFAVGQAGATGTTDCAYLTGTGLPARCVEFGERTTHGYDRLLRLVSIARQARVDKVLTDTTTYDQARRVVSTTDPYGRRTLFAYDVNDRVVRTVRDLVVGGTPGAPALAELPRIATANPPYVIEDLAYDAEGQVLSRIDARGITHTFAYDQQGRQVRQVQAAAVPTGLTALAHTTLTAYDRQGNRTSITHPRTGQAGEPGTFRSTFTYSGRNLLLSETEAAGRAEAATRSWTYTGTGRQATARDFRGNTTSFTYHPCCDRLRDVIEPGNHRTTSQYDRHGNLIAMTDANGHTATTSYDGRHRMTRVVNAAGEATTYSYDDNATDAAGVSGAHAARLTGLGLGSGSDGFIVAVENALGQASLQVHDGIARVVRTIDGNGLATTTRHDTVTLGLLQTEITDAGGHATRTRADAAGLIRASEDAENRKTTVGYDANGNRVTMRDPNQVGDDCVYDAADREVRCTDTAGSSTRRSYNAHGSVLTVTDPIGGLTTHAYDGRERRISITDRVAGITTFAYDANRNLVRLTDAEGRATDYVHDERDLLLSESLPPGDATPLPGSDKRTYAYDGARRLVRRTEQTGAVTGYAYDAANRLRTRSYPDGLDDTFTYDQASRLLSATSERFGTVVTRTYDAGSRVTAETQAVGGIPYTVGYGYDADNLVTRITYPDGKQVLRTYTPRHQLASVSYDGASIASRAYDAGGRFTRTTYGNATVETRTYRADNTVASIVVPGVTNFTYAYDPNKRKTYEGHQFASDIQEFTGYDAEDRLTAWKRDGVETQTWTLSKVGDWLSTVRDAVPETRTHSPVHETLTITRGGVSTALDYDPKGNLTLDQAGQRYDWDHENRLHAARAGAASSGYLYDALGRRLGKIASGLITTYVHDGARVIAEYEAPVLQSSAIGSPALPGTFSDDGLGTVSLSAGGTDIWNASDQFRYAYARLTGNGSITVRVVGQGHTDAWAKAGVMLRESLDAGARNAALLLTPTNGVTFQWRGTTGGTTVNTVSAGVTGPVWLRLTRLGVTITAERSVDGLAWTLVGSDSVAFPATPIHIGLAVTSHQASATSLATFTNLAFTGTVQGTTGQAFARGYVYGSYVDEALALVAPAGRWFYHANNLYSVAALSDAAGAVVERYRYDAYGERTVLAPDGVTVRTTARTTTTFTGRQLEAETGLVYYRSRFFDPRLGRFISRDPAADPDTRRGSGAHAAFAYDPSLVPVRNTSMAMLRGAAVMRPEDSPLFLDVRDPAAYAYLGNSPSNGTDPNGQSLLIVCSLIPVCSAAVFCSLNFGACSGGVVCSATAAGACSGSIGACSGVAAGVCSGTLGACSGTVAGACSGAVGACSGQAAGVCSGNAAGACSGQAVGACSAQGAGACSGQAGGAANICSGQGAGICSGQVGPGANICSGQAVGGLCSGQAGPMNVCSGQAAGKCSAQAGAANACSGQVQGMCSAQAGVNNSCSGQAGGGNVCSVQVGAHNNSTCSGQAGVSGACSAQAGATQNQRCSGQATLGAACSAQTGTGTTDTCSAQAALGKSCCPPPTSPGSGGSPGGGGGTGPAPSPTGKAWPRGHAVPVDLLLAGFDIHAAEGHAELVFSLQDGSVFRGSTAIVVAGHAGGERVLARLGSPVGIHRCAVPDPAQTDWIAVRLRDDSGAIHASTVRIRPDARMIAAHGARRRTIAGGPGDPPARPVRMELAGIGPGRWDGHDGR
jgi:RHS repeat-associated protein